MKKVAIIGLGYVGLPLAALCAKKGYRTVGFDTSKHVVKMLSKGQCHIKDTEVEKLLSQANMSGNFSPTIDLNEISDCNVYLICVPTPVDENQEPDLKPLIGALEMVGSFIKKNDLVVIESTVFPGTCEQEVIPLLEALSALKSGSDFHVAHCPERVNPGDVFWTSENIPRVVGATSDSGARMAAEFYASILGGPIIDVRKVKSFLRPKFSLDKEGNLVTVQIPPGSVTMMHSIRDAEAVKAMENTVRDVNIAFVNELAKISDVLDLDVLDIIDGMSTKPFGKGPFYPGTGVGGHCIAVDPEWLKAASKKAGYIPEIIQLARSTNNSMPEYAVNQLQGLLNEKGYPLKGTNVAVLGVAYKKNVDDSRESPFFTIRDILLKKGAKIEVYDSWIQSENTISSLDEMLHLSKAIFIVTDHSDMIEKLKSIDFSSTNVEVVLDGRNCLESDKIQDQGVLYKGIGKR